MPKVHTELILFSIIYIDIDTIKYYNNNVNRGSPVHERGRGHGEHKRDFRTLSHNPDCVIPTKQKERLTARNS